MDVTGKLGTTKRRLSSKIFDPFVAHALKSAILWLKCHTICEQQVNQRRKTGPARERAR